MSASNIFAVIGNIPGDYHSFDLRNYFSMFIEDGGFHTFHFRHRPEIKRIENLEITDVSSTTTNRPGNRPTTNDLGPSTSARSPGDISSIVSGKGTRQKSTTCCVVKVKESSLKDLIRMYDRKHWLDRNGDYIASVCRITGISTPKGLTTTKQDDISKYKTKKEMKAIPLDRETFTESDLEKLPELHPPPLMPNGNVGTPTAVFLGFIKECKLPPSIINKLGLKFPRKRTNKIYSNVHFDYGGDVETPIEDGDEDVVISGTGHELIKEGSNLSQRKASTTSTGDKTHHPEDNRKNSDSEEEDNVKKLEESGDDSDDCEDWERHEALHSDVAHHVERNKERLFEQKIELKWEKGGSGLVFYTDAQYWDAEKGDFDERTADDWDVDMSIYTDPRAGDKDARDSMFMRQEKRRRKGIEATDMFTAGIGKFEMHSKGFGRKVMEKQGWKEGEGLGPSTSGISEALENDGQKPYDRKGMGYTGEKLKRGGASTSGAGIKRRRDPDQGFIISTIYDNPAETDPPEPLYRSNDHHHLTYRHSFIQGETQSSKDKKEGKS